jgi:hypothetical protein
MFRPNGKVHMLTTLALTQCLALGTGTAAGGGLIYMLGGGGLVGAIVIFFVLKMIGGSR